ncbi:MAG TPA: L,D-transpeptidase [Bacillaceae bacterium]
MRLLLIIFLAAGSAFWPFDAELLPGDGLIIVNKKTNEFAWINGGRIVLRGPAATGKTNELTPEGLFTVKVKAMQPYYRKLNIQGGHPDNPLGSRWIGFDARGTNGRIYGLHGTNKPWTVGHYVSEGCIRLHKTELEQLYDEVTEGTRVLIVHTSRNFEELARESGVL